MSDKSSTPAAENAAGASSSSAAANATSNSSTSGSAPKKPLPEQNPAFKMMGLPRIRLPSRNWMIFWTITGSFAGAVFYDKWQTKRMREKWCNMVSHIADEPLDTKTTPRKITIYLSAPPGDGLRNAREHFHTYIKPLLVSAAMDWDVVEGRKEGDVRHKTAERIRTRRRRSGEGEPLSETEEQGYLVQELRKKNGDVDYPGVAGDLVVGRHTWKEYVRGLHEGYLGPPDPPLECRVDTILDSKAEKKEPEQVPVQTTEQAQTTNSPVQSLDALVPQEAATSPDLQATSDTPTNDGSESQDLSQEDQSGEEKKTDEEKKPEEEKPQRRFPPSYILPDNYETATLSASTPEIIGPSIGVRMPHLLGIRNTPIRFYRFLTRRRLQDDIGRQVASAILASHRPFSTVTTVDEDSASDTPVDAPEQKEVLAIEERDWWKTVRQPRKEHEESVWIEPMVFDERISSRMRVFHLTSEDEDRAKRVQSGQEKPGNKRGDED